MLRSIQITVAIKFFFTKIKIYFYDFGKISIILFHIYHIKSFLNTGLLVVQMYYLGNLFVLII